MNIFDKARRLEMHLAGRMTKAAVTLVRSGPAAREPIELAHAILDAVEREVQSSGRGMRVFPFNTVDVAVLAPSDRARARLEAIVDGDVPLRSRIAERLRAAGCQNAQPAVRIDYVQRAHEDWADPQFSVAFSRAARDGSEATMAERAAVRLEVVRGTAERRSYVFAIDRIDVGRGSDVRDSRNGLVRTNHVAFSDGSDDVSRSISRRHAHLAYDRSSGQLRLYDDGSVHGTRILRKGKTLAVPAGGRGGRLQSGDEIVLGEARLRVRFESVARR